MDRITEGYPLHWPDDYQRTPPSERETGRFTTTLADARNGILRQLRLMDTDEGTGIISSMLPLKNDGQPYATFADGRRRPVDPGVAVWFEINGASKSVACDYFTTIEANMQSLNKTIESLRSIDQNWHCSGFLERAFRGFAALPMRTGAPWWEVLHCNEQDSAEVIETAYKERLKIVHPDRRNNQREQYDEVQAAYREFRFARGLI